MLYCGIFSLILVVVSSKPDVFIIVGFKRTQETFSSNFV